MARSFSGIPFERYADDAICHCKSAEEAQALWGALADRFAVCKLVLHPEKTKIVYCKDANRRGDFPNQSFDFLGFSFRVRKTVWQGTIHAHGFMPAVSPKALTAISRTIRRWTLHHHSDKSLQDLAKAYNPYIQGWINYYGHFYRTQLRPTLKRIDLCHPLGAPQVQAAASQDQGGTRLVRAALPCKSDSPRSLAAMSWQRPNIGSRMNREVHVRFWERPGVKVLRATRQPLAESREITREGSDGPRSDMAISFNHLVGSRQYRCRHL